MESQRKIRKAGMQGRMAGTHRFSGMRALIGAVLAGVAISGTALAANPSVKDVRIGVNPDKSLPAATTRVVLELSESTPYSAFLLGDPYRLVIDLPELDWGVKESVAQASKGLVERFRFGLYRPGNSRVVVDLSQAVRIARHMPLGSNRLVFDLVPVAKSAFEPGVAVSASDWRPPTAKTPVAQQPRDTGDPRRLIVIDAGHGGVDPGAIRGGIYEKNLTLALAKEVQRALAASGRYRVVMTRDRDVFLELRERVDVARANNADLFVSLHADTHPNKATRGASVYTLSDTASDREAAALAAKENRVDIIAGVDLSGHSAPVAELLIELRQRQTMNESAVFANMLIGQFGHNDVGVLTVSRTHRFAGFAVLKSPDVPSVLVEVGYLSNRQDLALLRTSGFAKSVARAMLASIDEYFKRRELLSSSG